MGFFKKIVAGFVVGGVILSLGMPGNATADIVLGPEVTNYIQSRSNTVSVGIYDSGTGETYTYNSSKTYNTLSVVKMSILANVLYNKIPINNNENTLLTKMIVSSDNSSASTMWVRLGSDTNVQAFFNKVGMKNTIAGTGGWWGRTTTNVTDQLTMMKLFAYPNSILTDAQRAYGLNLMRSVQADQRWGTGYGLPSDVSVALKNGWYTNGQFVNSVGFVKGQGKSYVIAVLTTNNPSYTYAVDTINSISKMVWNEVPSQGWDYYNGKWYYYTKEGKYTGWLRNNNQWYFLDSTGAMKTGWVKYGGVWYYLNSSGAMETGWLSHRGSWYFLDQTGAMKTGWVNSAGNWYYLNAGGVMETGWVNSAGNWYYLNAGGVMETGWVNSAGNWYYLNAGGVMETGWVNSAGNWYYLNASGVMVKDWKKIDNKWYYLNQSGQMAADTTIEGYKIGSDGAWIQVAYVALGDSLASGMTPEGQDRPLENGVDPDWGYPNYIAKNFAKSHQLLNFTNFGVSGYTTDDLISDLEKENVQREIQNATHITIDIGINDLYPLLQTNPETAQEELQVISEKINTILTRIDQLNQNGKVYIMGYYNPLPYTADPEQKEQIDQVILTFNANIQSQANQHGDTYISTAQIINYDNFTKYIPNQNSLNPNALGYEIIAEEFWKVME